MSAPAIEIESVTKTFRLYHEKIQSAKERIIKLGRNPYEEFRALDDVSFEVHPGHTTAILGHNGSGKSTLLKCITGTLRPTSGRIATRGRVAALLELGAGFHPDLTGRENIYLNGSILGFSRHQIDGIIDDVVDFAEIELFIDNQVKHYSSGMYARLGFAVAINVDPDVLLIDEVLSVGDEAFQRKCIDRVKQLQREGRTILVVTHAADLVREICDTAAVLDHGRLVTVGSPGPSIRSFRETLASRGVHIPDELVEVDPTTGEVAVVTAGQPPEPVGRRLTKAVSFTGASLDFPNPDEPWLYPGQPLTIRARYHAPRRVDDVIFAMEIHDQNGVRVLGTNTDVLSQGVEYVEGDGEVAFELTEVPLLDGTFEVALGIHTEGGIEYDHRENLDRFSVLNPTRGIGVVLFPIVVHHTRTAPAVRAAEV